MPDAVTEDVVGRGKSPHAFPGGPDGSRGREEKGGSESDGSLLIMAKVFVRAKLDMGNVDYYENQDTKVKERSKTPVYAEYL